MIQVEPVIFQCIGVPHAFVPLHRLKGSLVQHFDLFHFQKFLWAVHIERLNFSQQIDPYTCLGRTIREERVRAFIVDCLEIKKRKENVLFSVGEKSSRIDSKAKNF